MKSMTRWKAAWFAALVAAGRPPCRRGIGSIGDQDRRLRCRDRTGLAELRSEYRGASACIVRALNDRGGVNGSKIELIVLDDKASPSEAASNAKRLMDDEQVLAVGQMSLSSTYAPMFQAAARTKTPLLLLGHGGVPGQRQHAADESLRVLRRQHVRSQHRAALAGAAGEGAGRQEQGQAEAGAGGDGYPDQPSGHRHDGKDRRHDGDRGQRQAGDSACRRRCQRCGGAHHLERSQLRDQLCAGLDDGADARCAAPPGMERLVSSTTTAPTPRTRCASSRIRSW